jgi:hypothetical protein
VICRLSHTRTAREEFMSIDVSLDRSAKLVKITPWKQFDVTTLTELVRVLDEQQIDPTFDLEFDLTGIDDAPSVITGLSLGTFWIDHRTRFQGRLSFVTPPRLFARQGIAIMEMTAWLAGIQTRVFGSESDSTSWLAMPRDVIPAGAPVVAGVHLSRLA